MFWKRKPQPPRPELVKDVMDATSRLRASAKEAHRFLEGCEVGDGFDFSDCCERFIHGVRMWSAFQTEHDYHQVKYPRGFSDKVEAMRADVFYTHFNDGHEQFPTVSFPSPRYGRSSARIEVPISGTCLLHERVCLNKMTRIVGHMIERLTLLDVDNQLTLSSFAVAPHSVSKFRSTELIWSLVAKGKVDPILVVEVLQMYNRDFDGPIFHGFDGAMCNDGRDPNEMYQRGFWAIIHKLKGGPAWFHRLKGEE